MCNDLASFKKTAEAERFFQNLRKVTDASVLMHHNDDILRFENELPNSGEELAAYMKQNCLAQILIPRMEISVQEQVL